MSDLQDAIGTCEKTLDSFYEQGAEEGEFSLALETVVDAARRVANPDYEAAYMEYLFSTGRYEKPEEVNVPITVRLAAEEYSKRIVDAALGVPMKETP